MSADDELVKSLRADADDWKSQGDDYYGMRMEQAAACIGRLTAALTAERERCAKVADSMGFSMLRLDPNGDHSYMRGARDMALGIEKSIRALPDPEGG